jgi:hypothetical protein
LPHNGSGTFTRVHNFATDKTNLVPVTASRMDAEIDGIATGLSTAICKDGQTSTSARIPFASGTSAMAGSISGVSYAQTNDANTGMYFPATDEVGLAAGGVAVLTSTATVVTVPVTLKASTTAKCWAYVTVSGGTPTLQTSENITSITDTDVGQLTITIATDFSSVNWVSVNTCSGTDAVGTVSFASKAAGSHLLAARDIDTHALVDPTSYNFVGFGVQ